MRQTDIHKLPRILVQQPRQLSDLDWAAWAQMRAKNPDIHSPYFHPDYTRLLAELRPDVRIVCQYDADGTPVAFLPVQGQRFARPVGAPMSDYHAIITNRDDVTYNSLLLSLIHI